MPTTWGEILEEVNEEYDLSEETFVAADELLAKANEAIQDIEKEMHTIDDDYFDTEAYLPLVSGTSTVAMPTDIYANKITGMYYDNGGLKYEIRPLKNIQDIPHIMETEKLRYRILNTTAGGTVIKFYPTPSETSSENVTVHYRRNAKLLVDEDSILDIPEGKAFIKQFVIDYAVNKERMTPDAPESAQLGRKRKLLLDSLENMIDDDNNEVGVNYDHYSESV